MSGAERCPYNWRNQRRTVEGFKYPDGTVSLQNRPILEKTESKETTVYDVSETKSPAAAAE